MMLPYNFTPRDYQLPVCKAMDEGCTRAVTVWHRRAGKEKTWLNIMIKKMPQRKGGYYYVFPTYEQGRKILWDGMDKDGFRFMDHFPKKFVVDVRDDDMMVKTRGGSFFQVVGSNKIDLLMGTNPVGVVYSEFSLQNPLAWDLMRPILAENKGWSGFDFTPRGENHAYKLYAGAVADPEWFSQLLTVDDTKAIARDVLERERREYVARDGNDALFQQEYYCNFTVPIAGSYFAQQIMDAYSAGRVGAVPYEQGYPVDTWWDLGISDTMSIWFTQSIGAAVRVIDYAQGTGQGLPYYAKLLQDRRYVYGRHIGPHDLKVRELGNGKSRRDTAAGLGIDFEVAPNIGVKDGIDAARMLVAKCWFDQVKCEAGLNALKNYRHEKGHPVHDWASHAADAFRYGALCHSATELRTKDYGQERALTPAYPFNPATV